jgi:DnaJ-class molecular chaperone
VPHYFRLQSADDDPERLLDPDCQRTEPWEGTVYGRCDKCRGSGRTEFRCESCRQGSTNPACPVCRGEVRYWGECPACGGSGEIDDSSRDGVSVFPAEEGLYRYMLRRRGNLGGALLVELEGEPTGDEDFDADEGALLIRPTRIVDVCEPDWDRIKEL